MSSFLRPPGVVSEKDFTARCISCGQCVAVCNFTCIVMTADYPLGVLTPKVFPQQSPCFLCMKCSDICPTGALRHVSMEDSGMGKAYLDTTICHDYQDKNAIMCWTCFERCPLKGTAIELANGYTPTITENCVGCGVCEYVCPTAAIQTVPSRKMGKMDNKGDRGNRGSEGSGGGRGSGGDRGRGGGRDDRSSKDDGGNKANRGGRGPQS